MFRSYFCFFTPIGRLLTCSSTTTKESALGGTRSPFTTNALLSEGKRRKGQSPSMKMWRMRRKKRKRWWWGQMNGGLEEDDDDEEEEDDDDDE